MSLLEGAGGHYAEIHESGVAHLTFELLVQLP